VIDTLSWDSPIRKAVEPEWWQFGNPDYALLADIRDFLGVIAVKTPAPEDEQEGPARTGAAS